VEFIETAAFTRSLPVYLDDEGYRRFQTHLMKNPQAGKVIPGAGGLHKVRWTDPQRGKGKRGGLRIIYYYLLEASHIWLIALYDKDEMDDLTTAQKTAYRRFITEIKIAWTAMRMVKM